MAGSHECNHHHPCSDRDAVRGSDEVIEEFLATSGMYPGLAEHLDAQRTDDEAAQVERLAAHQDALTAFDSALGKYPSAAEYLDAQRAIERRRAAQEP